MAIADARDSERRELVQRQREALLTGEQLEGEIGAAPEVLPSGADEINAKYERGEIRIVTESARYPLNSISSLLDTNNYRLDPDYQRRHRWTVKQKSRLIESFIMNVPVPPIFLYEFDYGKYEVMDGLQRMTAVREFYENSYPLSGMEYWQELDGMKYDQLPSQVRAGIDRRYISSIILLKETTHGDEDPELLKRFVFGRINTGGVKLSPQELRNALYDGPMNRLCKELASNENLRRLWGIPLNVEQLIDHPELAYTNDDMLDFEVDSVPGDDPVPEEYRKMMDVELVLRFFANRQRMVHDRLTLRDYFDAYLKAANAYDENTIGSLRSLFIDTVNLVWDLFGDVAFRRARNGRWGNEANVSIYDALMNVASRLIDQRDQLLARRAEVIAGLDAFYAENAAKFNLRGQTRQDLQDREVLFEEYLRSFI